MPGAADPAAGQVPPAPSTLALSINSAGNPYPRPSRLATLRTSTASCACRPAGRKRTPCNCWRTAAPTTTTTSKRGDTFYYRPGADEAVISTDEALKQTLSAPELAELSAVELPPLLSLSRSITVPTCSWSETTTPRSAAGWTAMTARLQACWAARPPYYRPEAQLHVVVAANSGHDLQLHRSAPQTDAAMLSWIDALSQ